VLRSKAGRVAARPYKELMLKGVGLKIVLFYHSLLSDWNHGNAHFLRGVASELRRLGHDVQVYEPIDAWSFENLQKEPYGFRADEFERFYHGLASIRYKRSRLDLNEALAGADIVIVHEWNDQGLVARIGSHHADHGDYLLFFHDTHHRSVTSPEEMADYDLKYYDGVLAFGSAVARVYEKNKWARQSWIWHEAADTQVFKPVEVEKTGDLVWIGNWGDEERTAQLREFLAEPVRNLKIKVKVYGVRYPADAIRMLEDAGIEYGGYLPNYLVPQVFSNYRLTVHIPRRPYAAALPGIPTIRVFEALACGIPLVSAPWDDAEGLFTPGRDFLIARNGPEMREFIARIVSDAGFSRQLAENGLLSIKNRHTCSHRVSQLMEICNELGIKKVQPQTVGEGLNA
jgi:spore maturation protein CgeB